MSSTQGSRTVYELDVVGQLGPVLRAMAETTAACSYERDTVLRLRGAEDLADVLDLCRSEGLEVTTIHAIR